MTTTIDELRYRWRQHADVAAELAVVLKAVEQSPLARLRVACAIYDAGGDPSASGLAQSLRECLEADCHG